MALSSCEAGKEFDHNVVPLPRDVSPPPPPVEALASKLTGVIPGETRAAFPRRGRPAGAGWRVCVAALSCKGKGETGLVDVDTRATATHGPGEVTKGIKMR